MSRLTPDQVNELLQRAPAPATVYLIGAGGCGMSGLGHLLLDLGFNVSGSDLVDNDEVRQLRSRGAMIHTGHVTSQLLAAEPVLVVYSPAVKLDNPEVIAAQNLQVPIVRRALLLAALVHRQRGICVAGMHGKTTTAALLAFALERLAVQPSYAVGALVPQLPRHARWGLGEATVAARAQQQPVGGLVAIMEQKAEAWFVAEADESDGTLREFHPEHSIVLNVDEEHLDFYANFEAICTEFSRFADQTSGHLVFCADDPQLVVLFARRPRAISVGFNPLAMYRIEARSVVDTQNGAPAGGSPGFEVWHGGDRLGEFSTGLIGEKNISNAACVVALLHQLCFPPAEIARAIAPFKGAARRQQELYSDESCRVFDDYGHHPCEITATLRALKEMGCRRLLVAFQPHRFTRTQHLFRQFTQCFGAADRLWVTEIFAASEEQIPGVSGAALSQGIRAMGQPVEFVPAVNSLPAIIRAAMRPGDLVLFLGAGDITRAAHELADQLRLEMTAPHKQMLAELGARLAKDTVIRGNEPLAPRTTLRVGGRADFYVEPATEEELGEVLQWCALRNQPFMLLGRGSNLLVRDGGVRGVVISLKHPHFSAVSIQGDRLRCGAGAMLKTVAIEARNNALCGMEFLEGIPGTVGGALRMNAGAMGSWTFDVVESVSFMDYSGKIFVKPQSQIEVTYRSCDLFKNHIALSAVFNGQITTRETVVKRMKECSKKRWESQPAAPSAGCIFKNPKSIPAGKLIDELGLKGRRLGGAVVSEVHGNFIVNDANATAWDVLQLIAVIQQRAREARGIELETEVEIVGED